MELIMPVGYTSEFRSQFNNFEQTFYFGQLFYYSLMKRPSTYYFVNKPLCVGQTEFPLDYNSLQTLLRDKDSREIIAGEFLNIIIRSYFINLYELFKGDDIRKQDVWAKDWFNYLRVLRNASAHSADCTWKDISKCKYIEEENLIYPYYKRCIDNKIFNVDPVWEGGPVLMSQIGGWLTLMDILNTTRDHIDKKLKENN
jgi:hypothetical protein